MKVAARVEQSALPRQAALLVAVLYCSNWNISSPIANAVVVVVLYGTAEAASGPPFLSGSVDLPWKWLGWLCSGMVS